VEAACVIIKNEFKSVSLQMPQIILSTRIHGSIETCFNLSRSIDLHQESMKHTGEQAVAGVTKGLIELDESVTWKARHFGIMMKLTSKITEFQFPTMFIDEMISGPFHSMKHRHTFKVSEGYTLMIDEFDYTSPLGILGNVADVIFLESYMKKLLSQRNHIIKNIAESSRANEYTII
jgi:ligand-binding SRPBCC domain-containing protein